jgi:ribonuclease HII
MEVAFENAHKRVVVISAHAQKIVYGVIVASIIAKLKRRRMLVVSEDRNTSINGSFQYAVACNTEVRQRILLN